MLWFYKEKKYLIISIIVIILDGIIIYFIPSYFNKLNCFYPMLTVSLIPFLINKNSKSWFIIITIIGFIYDLLYSNIFLYNMSIFLLLAGINKQIIKYFNINIFLYICLAILNIIIYDSITFFLIILTGYQTISISDLIYKIKNSLILNIMSVFVYYFMFKNKKLYHKL